MFSTLALLSWWLLLRRAALRRDLDLGLVRGHRGRDAAHAPVRAARPADRGRRRRRRSRGGRAADDRCRVLRRGYGLSVLVGARPRPALVRLRRLHVGPGIRTASRTHSTRPAGYTVPIDADAVQPGCGVAARQLRDLTVARGPPRRGPSRRRSSPGVVTRGRVAALAYTLGFVVVLVPLARALGTYFAYRRVESLRPAAPARRRDRDRRPASSGSDGSGSPGGWRSRSGVGWRVVVGALARRDRSSTTAPRSRTTARWPASSATHRRIRIVVIAATACPALHPRLPPLAGGRPAGRRSSSRTTPPDMHRRHRQGGVVHREHRRSAPT